MKRSSAVRFVAVLALAACAAPPYAALPIGEDSEAVTNVEISDGRLYDIVRAGPPLVERIAGTNQMRVSVPLQNIDQEGIQVLVQVSFLDDRRQPIGDETNSQVLLLAPGATVTHVAISKRAEAARWVMRIRWNR
jgi:hypothetical protein